MTRRRHPPAAGDPVAAARALGAIWSEDLDAYAAGQIDAGRITCALCLCRPCRCPPFGSPDYMRLLDARHGRRRAGAPGRDPAAMEGDPS